MLGNATNRIVASRSAMKTAVHVHRSVRQADAALAVSVAVAVIASLRFCLLDDNHHLNDQKKSRRGGVEIKRPRAVEQRPALALVAERPGHRYGAGHAREQRDGFAATRLGASRRHVSLQSIDVGPERAFEWRARRAGAPRDVRRERGDGTTRA